MWSPIKNANGYRNSFYDNMNKVEPGDLVFSYATQKVKAIGVVQKHAYVAPKPANFESALNNWSKLGWLVEMEFSEFEIPLVPKQHLNRLAPFFQSKAAPMDVTGRGRERYLVGLEENLGLLLIEISRANLELLTTELSPLLNELSDYEIELEIQANGLEGDLERIQLTKSRRGQGYFKANVRLVEKQCRITGVSNIKHLRASHIKPWSSSTKEEKLDGFNGLLLSPHVDHLFDQGFISFKDSGDLLVSRQLNPLVISQWAIPAQQNVGEFRQGQRGYLEYHRDLILKP